MNGFADAIVGAATTNVSPHSFIDFRIIRRAVSAEQRSRGHNLAALAVTALRDPHFDPGFLHRFSYRVLGDRFNSRYVTPFHRADRRYTGPDRLPIHMHGAGSAEAHATTKFSTGKSQDIAYGPQ